MDPLAIGANLLKRVNLSPEILEDFPSLFSAPEQAAEFARKHISSLNHKTCPDTGKEFVCGEFNQFEGCHRSPYSDIYVPDNPRGRFPAKTLREVELRGNDMLSEYVKCYYGNASSSFYVSETTDRGYMAYFAILKETYASKCEALHTISLNYEGHHKTHFKLNSYLRLNLKGSITSLNCNLEKQSEDTVTRQTEIRQELSQMLKMIESMENSLMQKVSQFCQGRVPLVADTIRYSVPRDLRQDFLAKGKGLFSELRNVARTKSDTHE